MTERVTLTRTRRRLLHVDSAVADLESLTPDEPTEAPVGESRKLAAARALGEQLEHELQAMTSGIISRLEEIGLEVVTAEEFKGPKEKTLSVVGKLFPTAMNAAQRLRLGRLEKANVKESIAEVKAQVVKTIDELGDTEEEYTDDVVDYQETLDRTLAKLTEATPQHLLRLGNHQCRAHRRQSRVRQRLALGVGARRAVLLGDAMTTPDRRRYALTDAQYDRMQAACSDIRIPGSGPTDDGSRQERINMAWTALGMEMGFDPLTVEDVVGRRFTAVPTP